MRFNTLISADDLAVRLEDPDLAVIDCRFTLGNIERGRQDYLQVHIPGAVYAHLEEDLCAPVSPGITGRHPLPSVEQLVDRFSYWGIDETVQVIAYDDWPGIGLATAARLWWSLRWLGHESVAVLDGGLERWLSQGLPVRVGEENRERLHFTPTLQPELLVTSNEVERGLNDGGMRLLDARSADRYRGENETIDPVAGHIPGAISAPFTANLGVDGLFLPPAVLQQRFEALLDGTDANQVVSYCGSGVTAAVNNLAIARAGLGDARLYVGSWSEWITAPDRPVDRGSV
jgi:thiosulfate/3-mercaptopyruvate sulfurtransferase